MVPWFVRLLRGVVDLRQPLWLVLHSVYALLVRLRRFDLARRYCHLLIRHRVRALREALRATGSGTIISFGYSCNVITVLSAQNLARRVIISERNDPDYMRPFYWPELARACYNAADLVTVNSHDMLGKLAGFVDAAKLTYIPNPLRSVGPSDSGGSSLRENEPTILIAARLAPQKNHVQLLAAFAQLPARMSHWRLAIIGEGFHRPYLEQTAVDLGIADRVDWYGFVPNPFAFYYAADIFVLPSLYEGQSNALLEAMSAGLPVVVTDIPAHAEVIRHIHNGMVVPVGDTGRLAAVLAQLGDDPALRARLGQAAAQHAARHHLEQVLPQWNDIVDGTAARERAAVAHEALSAP